jgi:hypothetical protein
MKMIMKIIVWFRPYYTRAAQRLTGWGKITINQYNRIAAVALEYQGKTDEKSLYEANLKLLSIVNYTSIDKYRDLAMEKYNELVEKHLKFIVDAIKPYPVKPYYKIKGKKYLLPFKGKRKLNMTAYQLVCYQDAINNTPDDIANLLSILLVPKGKKFADGYDTEELKELITHNFPIMDAVSIGFFFKILFQILLQNSIRTSKNELKNLMKKAKQKMSPKMEKEVSKLERQLIKFSENLTGHGITSS